MSAHEMVERVLARLKFTNTFPLKGLTISIVKGWMPAFPRREDAGVELAFEYASPDRDRARPMGEPEPREATMRIRGGLTVAVEDEKLLLALIRAKLHDMVIHEADEGTWFDGRLLNDPHKDDR